MKKFLIPCAICVILILIGGFWLWMHLLSPPLQSPLLHPMPNPTLSLIVEPRDGIAPVLALINNATTSIDLVMYELTDTRIEKALVAAHARGVFVRVLLNKGYYGAESQSDSSGSQTSKAVINQRVYDYLQENAVPVRWSPSSFSLTHEKLMIVDGANALIMGFNLTPAYYATSRDFAIRDSDSSDMSTLEDVFDADWNGTGISAREASDLVWSPHSELAFVSLIKSAKHSILIYNEEMSDREMIKALQDAAERGVSVSIIMTYQSTWKSALLQLAESGVHLHIYDTKAPLYIHAKMLIIDNGEAFIGSQNFSATSLNTNRELGILITKASIISSLEEVFGEDWVHPGDAL